MPTKLLGEFTKLTPKQRASIFKKVFSETTTGKYGEIVQHSNDYQLVELIYDLCKKSL